MFLEQKGFEMSFKEREGGTVTVGLREGVPEFGGHGAERPATQSIALFFVLCIWHPNTIHSTSDNHPP